ncbi:MAG: hypothetical protein Q7S83_00745 [bacterium]|nr:hypothetical protein [bacterium]
MGYFVPAALLICAIISFGVACYMSYRDRNKKDEYYKIQQELKKKNARG